MKPVGIEIEGVREDGHGHIEVDNQAPQFFTVYLRLEDFRVEAVEDFRTIKAAEIRAAHMKAQMNLPVRNLYREQHHD